MTRQRTRRLDPAEKIEAALLAEEMLLKRTSTAMIVAALVDEYAVSKGVAGRVLKGVIAEMQKTVNAAKPYRRAQQIASLDRLYEKCVDGGRLGTAVDIQRLLSKIEGTEAPQKHVHGGRIAGARTSPEVEAAAAAQKTVATMDDPEWDGRSAEELEYYGSNGFWPEQGPDSEDGQEAPDGQEFPFH